jgi:hypothetical protein
VTALGLVRTSLRRSGKLLPLARLLMLAELAVDAGHHIAKLEPADRTRMLVLLRKARGRPGTLAADERDELMALVSQMEPHVFLGTAATRLSPFPVPRRLIERGTGAVGSALRGRHRRNRQTTDRVWRGATEN